MPVTAGLGVLLVATAVLLRGSTASRDQMDVELRNPFDLGTVIWLALLIYSAEGLRHQRSLRTVAATSIIS